MIKRFILYCIFLYQRYLSPLLPAQCRFLPTCSQYAYECFTTLPLHKACYYSIKRILSCHPWNHGYYDPPPTTKK